MFTRQTPRPPQPATAAAAAAPAASLPTHHAKPACRTDTGTARGLDQEPVVDPRRFEKLASGVRYADLKVGTGDTAATVGSRVSLQWVLRRSNGYFVDSSLGALASGPQGGTLALGTDQSTQFDPFVFTVGDGRALPGLDEGVRGMRAGGVRRLVLPLKAAYTTPIDKCAQGPLPQGFGPRRQLEREYAKSDPYNYIFFEVEAIRVRGS